MALTGLEIYKQLPKKNCGECGPPTCLAFAMALAGGKASLDSCPYVSDQAKAMLESASAPPIAKVVIGRGDCASELGDETELFRHDKKFYHETAIGFAVSDTLDQDALIDRIKDINGLRFARVGLEYRVQVVAICNDSGDAGTFKNAVACVAGQTDLALALVSDNPAAQAEVAPLVNERRPVIYAATAANYEKMAAVALANNCPLAVKGEGLESLAELVDKVVGLGVKQLIIDPGARETSQAVAQYVQIRRQAIKKKFRSFGYPIIAFTSKEDPMEEIGQAAAFISKYASVVVLRATDKALVLPLLTWRQNLYTDPQVPIRVEEKLNAVGQVNENSPVYVTTNFSLTYYSVAGEVEASKIPGYIVAVDTDGLSVLTAYADGKFEADKIAAVIKKTGVEEKVSHRKLVIPGTVAVLKGKLEDESGWQVIVGPREASGISAFAKSQFV